MKSQTRITKHGKRRIRERVDSIHNTNALARIVSKNGKSKGMYQGKFHQYLLSKSSSGARIKVYQNNIYILSKNTKRLITTYPVPEKYLPTEQFEISDEILILSNKVKMYLNKPVIIELNNGEKVKGYIDGDYDPEVMSKFILTTDDDNLLIELNEIMNIDLDFELMSEELKDAIGV